MSAHSQDAASTLPVAANGEPAHTVNLATRSLASVHESVDPRLDPKDRPGAILLDQGYVHQLVHHGDGPDGVQDKEIQEDPEKSPESDQPLYVEFEDGDPRNPSNFSYVRKWVITLTASFFSISTASSSGAYALGFSSMTHELNATHLQATAGLSTYLLGIALVPLVSTSFSEEFGRQPIYILSGVACLCFHIMTGLSKNIQTVIIARLLAGASGSSGSAMVGGTIADIWAPHERGLPMAVFALQVLTGPGIGCVVAGWLENNPHFGWRWIQWVHAIWIGIFVVAIPIAMKETRSGVLLTRMAKMLRKETGNPRYRARVEDERASLRSLIYISCTRPIYLLFTELLVAAFSLWAGFAWSILYVLIESIPPAFQTIHGFNIGETGSVFAATIVGCFAGAALHFHQEKLYAKHHPTKGPEARLFAACLAAVLFPAGMFIYAWCAFPSVPWIGMAIGIFVLETALFTIYVAVFTYLADCYGQFASSALAGQSLTRNVLATVFPLFSEPMFSRLTYRGGLTLFACIGVLMIPLPFILLWKGPVIRARSKFASQVVHNQRKVHVNAGVVAMDMSL